MKEAYISGQAIINPSEGIHTSSFVVSEACNTSCPPFRIRNDPDFIPKMKMRFSLCTYFLNEEAVKNLRDFCNAVLNSA